MSTIKDKLYRELELKIATSVEGISFDPRIFRNLDITGKYQEEVHCVFEYDHEHHVGIHFPAGFLSPHGLTFPIKWDRRSQYSFILENDVYYLTYKGVVIFPIEFLDRPEYYAEKTSDGTPMNTLAVYTRNGAILTAYSNECAFREKGRDCKFCNINATKQAYGEAEGIGWKYPHQIGETVAAAYRLDGARHFTLTGGFVAERREVEYYLDVADSIREHTGLDDFNGTAVIGAPHDLSVIEKYKEAGFRTIATNIEIWDKHLFRAICPGKAIESGGWGHWVKTLEHEVAVFGRGKVRSNIVAGIEPKESTLEGVEYLASKGVLCLVTSWNPNPGSAFEGHRAPEPEWHIDLFRKVAGIFRRNGYTWDELYDCSPTPESPINDIYRIEEETLPVFNRQVQPLAAV
ncbi:MAG: nitrogen fixation protein NifB [Chlorobiaceae bacterium]|nr:nitrogen fixation protein NifB [Chlorobiaceae bacterium]